MTDERKKFESMVKATWGDSYNFAQNEYSHYRDFVLDAMWWGWQARGEGTPEPQTDPVLDLEAPPDNLRSGIGPYRVAVKIEWEQEQDQ